MHKIKVRSILFICFLFLPFSVFAQMFSVGSENRTNFSDISSPYLRAGIQIIDFKYTRDVPQNSFIQPLSFTGPAAYLAYESMGLNLNLTLGNSLTTLDDRTYIGFNLKFINPFYVVRDRTFRFGIPIKLDSKITSVKSSNTQEQFNQTSLNAGAGLTTTATKPGKFSINAEVIPSYGFSTASNGFIGGGVFTLTGKARLNFFNLLFNRNISFGYDYVFDSYNIEGIEYDYDFSGHTITIGVSL